MDALFIGSRREVCWDEALIDSSENVNIQMHKPEYRGVALECDAPWEGCDCNYASLVRDGNHYRFYYRGLNLDYDENGNTITFNPRLCYAESGDGKTLHRVSVGVNNFWGTTDNNILSDKTDDNIFIFKDTNPNCAPDELYKGLCGMWEPKGLWLYASADGVHFDMKRILADDGNYDSLNTCFWDKETEQYYLFYRTFHGVRDISMRTSKDFVNWSEPQLISYGEGAPIIEMYTNNVQKYYRAPHMFLGMPTRYIDRAKDPASFSQLPDWKHRQLFMRYEEKRSGTAMTDACLMTSRDGVNFRRTNEAFLTPGIECGKNWYYGNCYFAHGMAETESDIPGEPNEISLFVNAYCRAKAISFLRYAVRLDGFFSWRCDFTPGKVITKPIIFEGDYLSINFSTSALGSVRIRILDENGAPIDGYDSGNHFGDSVDRIVGFEKPLKDLSGRAVRLEITMSDADLYSFRFDSTAL